MDVVGCTGVVNKVSTAVIGFVQKPINDALDRIKKRAEEKVKAAAVRAAGAAVGSTAIVPVVVGIALEDAIVDTADKIETAPVEDLEKKKRDEEKKKQALDSFSDYIEKKKQQLKQELSLEGKKVEEEMEQKKKEALGSKSKIEQGELIEQEIELTKRQKTTVIAERLDQESKKLDEIYDALLKLLKGLRIGAVLSEDEYFKILEYDIPVFFTIRTGAEGLLELLEKIDIAGLIASLRKEAEKAKGQKYLKLIGCGQ